MLGGRPLGWSNADMQVLEVPIAQIEIPERQVRRKINQESIRSLADSIAQVGLLHPITVCRTPEGTYRLLAGERRLRACQLLSFENIQCVVAQKIVDATSLQLVENEQRCDLDPLERAVWIMQYLDQTGLSKRAVAAQLGIPRPTMLNWLLILEASERHQQAIVDNFRRGTSILTLAHLAVARRTAKKLGNPQLQDELLDLAEAHSVSHSDLSKACDLLISHPKLTPLEAIQKVRPIEIFKKPRFQKESPRIVTQQNTAVNRINDALELAGRCFHELDQGLRLRIREQERQVLITKLREIEELALDLALVLSSMKD